MQLFKNWIYFTKILTKLNEVDESTYSLGIGFVIKQGDINPYTKDQREFLKSKFEKGETTS